MPTIHRPMVLKETNNEADLTFWGDIYENRPCDMWTGEPAEGDFIILDEVIQALSDVKVKSLTIHLNSYGGDAGVSNTIHNKLREMSRNGVSLTCIVDGVAMSGGSLIMCACDTVRVNPASLIMIHKCWSALWGAYNADELRELASTQDAWDKAQIEIYQRKTGLSKTVLDHMMSETTYMTGREAVEKGFADELIEGSAPLDITASADRRMLFVNGRTMRLNPGIILPDSVPIRPESPSAQATSGSKLPDPVSNIQPEPTGIEGGNPMTLDELRAQYPDLIEEAEGSGAAQAAQAERNRLSAIDEVASLFPAELVAQAKYGDVPMTAQELAYQAAIQAAQTGKNFLTALEADNKASNANAVTPAPSAMEDNVTSVSVEADAKRMMDMYLANRKEAR